MDECGYHAIWLAEHHFQHEGTKTGAWFAGPPEELVGYLRDLESRFPGLEHVNMSISMSTPKGVMLEQLRWFAGEVMPKFSR
jgi:hypothetical protein